MTRSIFILAVALLATALPVRAADLAENRFSVFEYRVLGNTVLKPADIERKLYPMLGEQKSIEDVEEARKVLEALYRDSGYGTVFIDIPEQDVDGGIVRLKVTEGRLDRVRISGARYFSNGQIRTSIPALKQGEVVYFPALQEQLSRINQQSRDRQVTPVLRAGREPGTVDMDLRVQDTAPFHMNAEVNNRYSANTTPTRASINLSYDNLFQRYQSLSLQYQTSPEDTDEVRVLGATYLVPLIDSGNVLAFYAVDTNSDFAAVGAGGDLAILGAGRIYGARYIMRLPAMDSYNHSFTAGADYKDFKDNILLPGGINDVTPIEYVVWSLAYAAGTSTKSTTTNFSLSANFGVRGAVNELEDFEYKRYNAQPNFMYWRGDVQHERKLWESISVYARFGGQFSTEPLISNEQFAIGGADTVRGYLEAQNLGDYGVSGTFEVRSPSLHRIWESQLQRLVGFMFYDAGSVRTQDVLPGQFDLRSAQLASFGAGWRLSGFKGVEAALDWAYPLKNAAEIAAGESRLHFSVRYSY